MGENERLEEKIRQKEITSDNILCGDDAQTNPRFPKFWKRGFLLP